jgi:SAM-dependent methyltransferase
MLTAPDITQAPMSSDQLETLLRELASARAELDEIHQSPAWRFITVYRNWLRKGRQSAPVRLVDRAARFGIRLFGSAAVETVNAPASSPEGRLVHCLNPMYLGRVFYCRNGKRHWVRSKAHLEHFDARLSLRDVVRVSDEEMQQYALAGPLPLPWSPESWEKPDRSSMAVLREITTCRLQGSGVEFGAGTDPIGVPLRCEVKYADFFSDGDLRSRAYHAQGTDFVPLSYVMSLEDMGAVADESLDFVIACHVIEHVRNPLRAFEQAYRKLKPGGSYVLIVPDMRRIFDRDRELTSLEHVIADYEEPSVERDRTHYVEFMKKARFVPDEQLAARADQAMAEQEDIHFHTWTYESFGAMVKYIRRKRDGWSSVWSQPCIEEDPGAHEYYFVLVK